MEVTELLRLVLGFLQLADGAETLGVAVAGFGEQDVGSAQVFFDTLKAQGAGDRHRVRTGIGRRTA